MLTSYSSRPSTIPLVVCLDPERKLVRLQNLQVGHFDGCAKGHIFFSTFLPDFSQTKLVLKSRIVGSSSHALESYNFVCSESFKLAKLVS